MPKPLLIIVSGPPCSGKTSLGLRLAQEFRLPFIYKDGIKERLFDHFGWQDREWSKKLGAATYNLLYYFVATQLAAGRSHIVESNFAAQAATGEFLALQQKYGFESFQIQCYTEGAVLLARAMARAVSGQRHAGHDDGAMSQGELRPILLRGRLDKLEIGGHYYELDTTDFASIDYSALFAAIRAAVTAEVYM